MKMNDERWKSKAFKNIDCKVKEELKILQNSIEKANIEIDRNKKEIKNDINENLKEKENVKKGWKVRIDKMLEVKSVQKK